MLKLLLSYICFLILSCSINKVYAQDGSLDLSFNTDGLVTTAFGTFDDKIHGIALQTDGKIVAAGIMHNTMNYDFAVARYNTNGSLDSTFGTGGLVSTGIGTFDDKGRAIAIQPDGKIIVVGESYLGTRDVFAVARYNTNGTLDTTFDHDGIATTSFGTFNAYPKSVALQSDGRIVVCGGVLTTINFDHAVVRYNANGSLDNSFDVDGKATIPLSANASDLGNAIAIQSDGMIVITGQTSNGTNSDISVIRLDKGGNLDLSFDTDGMAITPLAGTFNEYGTSLAIQSNGKILVTGFSNNSFTDFIVARYNSNGSLDTSFEHDGIVITDFGVSTDFGNAVDLALQVDGKIVVAGYRNSGTKLNFALVRYFSNGLIDSTFDGDGLVSTSFGANTDNDVYSVAIQSDGKIVIAGGSHDGTQKRFALARYNNAPVASVIENSAIQNYACNISPNPFKSSATIFTNITLQQADFVIYDALGKVIRRMHGLSGNEITIERGNLPAGIYYWELRQNQVTVACNKMAVID